ncbi:hypothetical protein [Zhihengliuella halotolerans]|uniref:hypothetical protein n=1 Tax=Zhihengliuella halotolerans TaxID=370736 RepID=UPI00102C1114|nr:hypothetical protein [Zhihengliuella halotolerans]
MSHRRIPLLVAAALAVCLVSCASPDEPDWETASGQAGDFVEAAEDDDGYLGSGWLRVSPEDSPPGDEDGVTLDYPSGATIEGLNVVCFGNGTISFDFTTQSGSSGDRGASADVECDGTVKPVELGEPLEGVDALRFNGIVADGTGAVVAASVTGTAE